mgnify:CR=1 FL=1
MSEFGQRVITAIIFGIVVLGSVWLGSVTFSILLLVMAIIGLKEFAQLASRLKGVIVSSVPLMITGGGIFLLVVLVFHNLISGSVWEFLMLVPFILLIIGLYIRSGHALVNSAIILLALVYVIIPLIAWLGSAMMFHDDGSGEFSSAFVFAYLAILWSNDSGAYLAGRSLGKHKLFERISPKKTWEGFIGGLLLAGATGFVTSLFVDDLSITQWVALAVIISITATLGDLVESQFKRNAGVKDSGSLMPGHGGVLDRFDGLFVSAPFVYVFLLLLKG